MKLNLKFIAALLCLHFAATTAFSQTTETNKKAFIGIWELAMVSTNGQLLQNTGPGYLKAFNADDTFANIQVRNTGAVISHSGKYTIDDAQSFTETASYRIFEKADDDPLGTGFKINYEFSDDKKLVTFKFTFKDGVAWTEVWRKL